LFLTLLFITSAAYTVPVVAVEQANINRLDEVEPIGKHVMPF